MFHFWVVLGLLPLCVKSQTFRDGSRKTPHFAEELLPVCGQQDVVKGEYFGEMDGSGLANLSLVNGKGLANGASIIRLSEPGALSGIYQKYRLPTNISIVQGVLYNHRKDWKYPAKVTLISWETAGGDNYATMAADNLTAYEGEEIML